MNGLPERLATSCPKTWEGSGDLSGSQGDGMHWGGDRALSPLANQRPQGHVWANERPVLGTRLHPSWYAN